MILAATLALLLAGQDNVSVVQVLADERSAREAPIDQLSMPGETTLDAPERGAETVDPDDVPQLSTSNTDVEFSRVEGIDRCSAELLSAADAAYCARRLENRSDEFTPETVPTLSAEQVLIGERRASRGTGDLAERSRMIDRRDVSADDRDLQALASITLEAGVAVEEPASQEETPNLPAGTQVLIEAIVEQLGGPGGGGE